MPVEVKICGLSTLATLDAALDAGADLIGLNLLSEEPALCDDRDGGRTCQARARQGEDRRASWSMRPIP